MNTLGGGSCINPEIAGVRYYEIGAKLYSTELNNVSDPGLYYTVDKKLRYDTINGEAVLMYSRYEGRGNGSSVYKVTTGVRRVLSEHVDAYSYTGGIIGNDAEDHLEYEPAAEALAEMKLTPYKGLSSETIIRYLYTGREYNIETGDYYYRYRVMDPSVGRFISKDNVNALNRYFYADDDPVNWVDPMGLLTLKVELTGFLGFIAGGQAGKGIAIGISKECGFTFGVTSSAGAGAGFGASASVSATLGSQKSVAELSGESIITGGSAKAGWGGGGGVELSGTGAGFMGSFGFGVSATGGSQVVSTTVDVIVKGKCK